MRILRYLIILFVLYAGLVVVFESMLGYFQPERADRTMVLTTIDDDGNEHDRVVSLLTSGGKKYVGVNHWPRAWWKRTKANPNVKVTENGEAKPHIATTISGAEHEQVEADNPSSLTFRILTGFPPRYFVRLDPVEKESDG